MSDLHTDDIAARPVVHRPRWLAPTSLVLADIGLLVSAYLTYEHFTGSQSLICNESQTVNCLQVTTSKWSSLLGIPVALLGLFFFVAITMLCLPPVWRRAPRSVDHLRLALTGVGVVMVLYLVWAELFKIHAICSWCTVVHVTTFVLLIVLAIGAVFTYEDAGRR